MYCVKVIENGSVKKYIFNDLEKLFTYVRFELMSLEYVEVYIENLKLCPFVEYKK